MKHVLELDDLELTALMTHLEGQSEIMNESRLNSSNPETPDREEILLNMVYANVFTLAYEADKNPNTDYDFDDYQEEWGEYNEVIYEVEDQNVFDQKQLVLEGVL